MISILASPSGIKQSLIAKLKNAKKSLEKGNVNAARGQLLAFKKKEKPKKGKQFLKIKPIAGVP